MFNNTETRGDCIVCAKQTTSRKCSHCSKDFVCSDACEATMFDTWKPASHAGACSRPRTTTEILRDCVTQDKVPDEPQTMADFGFNRCYSVDDQRMLLRLYGVLMTRLDVKLRDLRSWMTEGNDVLRRKIEVTLNASLSRIPQLADMSRWFYRNRYIWDETRMNDEARAIFGAAFPQRPTEQPFTDAELATRGNFLFSSMAKVKARADARAARGEIRQAADDSMEPLPIPIKGPDGNAAVMVFQPGLSQMLGQLREDTSSSEKKD